MLRHREADVYRRQLIDHYQRWRVVGLYQISLLNQYLTSPPLDGRTDHRVFRLDARVFDRGLGGTYGCGSSIDIGAKLRVGILRHKTFLQQILVALFLLARTIQLRLVTGECGPRLLQLRLQRARVDFKQQLPFCNILPIAKAHLDDLTIEPRLYRHGGLHFDIADGLDFQRHGLLADRCDYHRNSGRAFTLFVAFFSTGDFIFGIARFVSSPLVTCSESNRGQQCCD